MPELLRPACLIGALGLLLSWGPASAASTARHPFPRMQGDAYGIRGTHLATGRAGLQRNFREWIDTFYVEGTCKGTDCARIRFDDRKYTVSEGIGYAMLIMVYMDNAQNDTRPRFDRLWAYYNSFLDGKGLMNWKIEGFTAVNGSGAATDAELDVALALMMAYKQWDDTTYLNSARRLVDLIYKNEVDGQGYLMPGDGWNTAKNPSYSSTAAMRLFDSLPGQNGRWASVVEKSYGLLSRNTSAANSPVGLPSDWSDTTGKPVAGTAEAAGNFGYEALRTPWRMSIAYAWFGDSTARNVAGKIASFATDNRYPIAGKVANLLDGYKLADGGVFHSANYAPSYTAVFVGAFGVAGMVDAKYSAWVDGCYDTLANSTTGGWYYDKILQVMFGLNLSGEFNNLWASSASSNGVESHGTEKDPGEIKIRAEANVFRIAAGGNLLREARIHDLSGRAVATIMAVAGLAAWDARAMPRGLYLLQARLGNGETRACRLIVR